MQRDDEKSIPSDKKIQRWMAAIRMVNNEIAAHTIALSPKGRMKRLKPRRKGEKVTTLIAYLAKQQHLEMTEASSDVIQLAEERARQLRPLQQAVSGLERLLTDTIMMSESQAWWATTALYSTLRVLARRDAQLQRELAPAKKFFALGKRKPKAPPEK